MHKIILTFLIAIFVLTGCSDTSRAFKNAHHRSPSGKANDYVRGFSINPFQGRAKDNLHRNKRKRKIKRRNFSKKRRLSRKRMRSSGKRSKKNSDSNNNKDLFKNRKD